MTKLDDYYNNCLEKMCNLFTSTKFSFLNANIKLYLFFFGHNFAAEYTYQKEKKVKKTLLTNCFCKFNCFGIDSTKKKISVVFSKLQLLGILSVQQK